MNLQKLTQIYNLANYTRLITYHRSAAEYNAYLMKHKYGMEFVVKDPTDKKPKKELKKEKKLICKYCKGSGLIECTECTGGTQYLSDKMRWCNTCSDRGRITCYMCGGDGKDHTTFN